MKLLELELNNFRQFEGRHRMGFAADGNRPVTLIHGCNGGGKTTILNALTWALCGQFTPNFARQEDLVSAGALGRADPGQVVTTSVRVLFEHQRNRYDARRIRSVEKRADGSVATVKDDALELMKTDDTGATQAVESPYRILEQILPVSLYSFFFFDGEQIEALARPEKKQREAIAHATRSLMGVEILDRAIHHLRGGRGLKSVGRRLEDELHEGASTKLKTLLEEKHGVESDIEGLHRQIEAKQMEMDSASKQIEAVDGRLRELQPARELQKRREELQRLQATNEEGKVQTELEIKRIVAAKAFLAPLKDPALLAIQKIEGMRSRGELPAGIKREFVDELLQKSECICGRGLPPGSSPRSTLESWRDRAGLADIESRALGLRGQYHDIESRVDEFHQDLEHSLDQRTRLTRDSDRIAENLKELSERIQRMPQEDIASLETQRQKQVTDRDALVRESGALRQKIEDKRAKFDSLGRDIKHMEGLEERTKLTQRRLKVCDAALAGLDKLREVVEDDVRRQLQHRISAVFERLAFKGYQPRLGHDFSLTLRGSSDSGTDVPMSAGESQILSLSFIGSIIEMLREKNADDLLGEPSPYPMVMDSPFGTLDEEHRTQVAARLPQLAPQIVLLVSETQWEGQVERNMMQFIGKEYVVNFHASSERLRLRGVTRLGREYAVLSKSSTGFDHADLQEVPR